jgi:8-oxo-dGTP pyrophosphatase MutT (NUDIX family)
MVRIRVKNIYPEVDMANGRQFSAMVVVIDDMGRVLLLHRLDSPEVKFSNQWGFPGGGSEPNEEPLQTAIRETYEETGLRVDASSLVLLYEKATNKKNVYFFVTDKYEGRVDIKKVKREHQNYAWVRPNELDMYYVTDDLEYTVRKAFGTNQFLME